MNSRIFTNPNELSVSRATGRLHEVFMRLEGRCINYDDLQLIIDQPLFADQVADLFRRKGVYLSAEDATARVIMGPLGVFGPQEWDFFFDIKSVKKDFERAATIGFPITFLEERKDTHLLCWFPPYVEGESLTIAYIKKNTNRFGFVGNRTFSICDRSDTNNSPGIRTHAFVSAQACRPGWHLIRKEALPMPEDPQFLSIGAKCGYYPLACEEFCKNIFYLHLAGGGFQSYHDPYLNPKCVACVRATAGDMFTELGLVAVIGRCGPYFWRVSCDELKIVCATINGANYGLGESFRPVLPLPMIV